VAELVDLCDAHASVHGHRDVVQTARGGYQQVPANLVERRAAQARVEDAVPTVLERRDALQECLAERTPDGHHLADRFHLGAQRVVRLGELFHVPAGDLGHHIVDSRLKEGRRNLRDVVRQFVQAVPDREFGGHLGDGEARRLRGQRRRARYAGVHFDDQRAASGGVYGELQVGATGSEPDAVDNPT